MIDVKTDYSFSARERAYFDRQMQQFNAAIAAGIQMICTQQDLVGQWRLKPDGSGLERADLNPVALPLEALPNPAADKPKARKGNGLA